MDPRTIITAYYLSELGRVDVAKRDITDWPLLEIEILLQVFANEGLDYEIKENHSN